MTDIVHTAAYATVTLSKRSFGVGVLATGCVAAAENNRSYNGLLRSAAQISGSNCFPFSFRNSAVT